MFVYSAVIIETKSLMNCTDSLLTIIPSINYKFYELDLMNHNLFSLTAEISMKIYAIRQEMYA